MKIVVHILRMIHLLEVVEQVELLEEKVLMNDLFEEDILINLHLLIFIIEIPYC